jgi:hypothetical protein
MDSVHPPRGPDVVLPLGDRRFSFVGVTLSVSVPELHKRIGRWKVRVGYSQWQGELVVNSRRVVVWTGLVGEEGGR